VSVSDAVGAAAASETAYKNALSDRQEAYSALNIAKQGDDLKTYLNAVQQVAEAEQRVTDAAAARVTAGSAFASQIADAKKFGSNLNTLLGQGLQRAGLEQLLNLGPTAGAAVTSEILAGTSSLSVATLNQSLADLAAVQSTLSAGVTARLGGEQNAAVAAAQQQADALARASIGAPGVGQGMTINITAGVGDPVEIGRQVKKVLNKADTRAGTLVVTGPKKKKGRR